MKRTTLNIRVDSAGIIQQSRVYTDPNRIIAEFVDNSIDAAEDCYNGVVYRSDIEVMVRKHQDRKISITDNASGMLISPDQPYTIFRSSKRNDPKTNGMFGFGMFSFMSICKSLEIETWHRELMTHSKLVFTSDIFGEGSNTEPSVELATEKFEDKALGGTIVTLYDFFEEQFEDISIATLKKHIERHFELILQRSGISVTLKDEADCVHSCNPFNYNAFCRNPYKRTIHTLHKTHSKRQKSVKDIDVSTSPAKIHLVVSENTEFNRPVFFVVKGRRVADVSNIEQFRTKRKYQIWSRSNVTGYIDVTGILTPVLSRNDFVRNELSKAFFHTLLEFEDEIVSYIDSNIQMDSSESLRTFEAKISEALKELEYEENAKGRSCGSFRGKRIFTIKGPSSEASSDQWSRYPRSGLDTIGSGLNGTPSLFLKRNKAYEIEIQSNTKQDEPGTAQLEVRIDTVNMPHTDLNGLKLRSVMSGNTVHIFRKHEDFQMRVKSSPKGHEEVNQRLINYIAMEVSMHYLNRKTNYIADESNENKIRNFITTVLMLEEKLKSLDGTRI